MAEDFQLQAGPVATLKAILGMYTFSVGILRELLQNSDDAGASTQIFVLDHRKHRVDELYHPKLASTQGPGLLAFNDAMFKEEDWVSLQNAFESSKSEDTSKIGKYGIGFRSVYHLTDCPQILSGPSLTISDPLQAFIDCPGKRIQLPSYPGKYAGQIEPFSWFFPERWDGMQFNGTVIRCPLRTTSSKIHSNIFPADKISRLLRDFIEGEMDISLLFLHNIVSIEVHEIDENGVATLLGSTTITRRSAEGILNGVVTSITPTTTREKSWQIIHCPFTEKEAITLFQKNLGYDPTGALRRHKFVPAVSVAMPSTITTISEVSGRLFTYLPLETKTGFPIHIHALFALTQSRQSLRNSGETGIVDESDDHVFIEWNRLLFDHFIPQAWRNCLQILVQQDGVADIFRAWPPYSPPTLTGDSRYWQDLPSQLFNLTSDLPIWPVCGPQSTPVIGYKPLLNLVAAAPSTAQVVLYSLIDLGVKLTKPPAYIMDLIQKDAGRFTVLSPETAYRCLLDTVNEDPSSLSEISQKNLDVVLEYLLSTDNVLNIVDLPFFTTVGGQVTTLCAKGSEQAITHTLLTRPEYDVFGACDDNAIALHLLPPTAARVLQKFGPSVLDIENLASAKVVDYLTLYPNRLGLDLSVARTDPRAVQWLSAFWVWMDMWPDKGQLFPLIRTKFLLPSTKGLRTLEKPLFKARGEHPTSLQHLSSLGVLFLDPGLAEAAQSIIAAHGLINSIHDIHDVLDALPLAPIESMSVDASAFVLRHFSAQISASFARFGAFEVKQISALKQLPIFPILSPSQSTTSTVPLTRWGGIPADCTVRAIPTQATFLPEIPNITFANSQYLTAPLLEHIQPDYPKPLSDADLLNLTLEYFASQRQIIQAAVLNYILLRRSHVPPMITETLKKIPFVIVVDGSKRPPIEVIDPLSSIAPLYDGDVTRQVRRESNIEKDIVMALRNLRLMLSTLTVPMAEERIKFISSKSSEPSAVVISKALFSQLNMMSLDKLRLAPEHKWIPTNRGLVSFEESREDQYSGRFLYDRVLAILVPGIRISNPLRSALGWDKPIPFGVIVKQLDVVLNESSDSYEIVVDIIKELARRDCSSSELAELQSTIGTRGWVPTANGQLSETFNAVFSSPIEVAGFHQISTLNPQARGFLTRMGCAERPSVDAIITKLLEHQTTPSPLQIYLSLLKSLPQGLDDGQSSRVLVPDTNIILRPLSATYFNDIADRASLVPLTDLYLAHPAITDELADHLGMVRLGLRFAGLKDLGNDMGVKPLTSVQNTLKQYTEEQFATEFLANAVDAGAKRFAMLLNSYFRTDGGNLLSPAMRSFVECPSLIVYNDSVFTTKDFNGICATNIGGKEDRSDTIGQFGLGALTMFFFTELAIVISNDRVLFLNPSAEHLPTSGKTALEFKLNDIRNLYPGHLSNIDGLFGFQADDDQPYNGTMFYLPLRAANHCPNLSPAISRFSWHESDVDRRILTPFSATASSCLLFTPMDEICGQRRTSTGDVILDWSVNANRTEEVTEDYTGYTDHSIEIKHNFHSSTSSSTWRIAATTNHLIPLPPPLSLSLEQHSRLRVRMPAVAGLALCMDNPPPELSTFKYFSTLPLAVSTTLPVHISSSFVLSQDRRHIRSDDSDNVESEYNRWLLTKIIPPLYLFMLENLARSPIANNKKWWPALRRGSTATNLTRMLEVAFYSEHLGASPRAIFNSMINPDICLRPQNAVLSGSEPPCVHHALQALRSDRLVKLPDRVRHRAIDHAGLAAVDPQFLRDEILRDPFAFYSDFNFENLNNLEELIRYLSPKDALETLVDLPILPLADETFGVFRTEDHDTKYFAWVSRQKSKPSLFPLSEFVHPDLKAKELIKLKLNVIPFSSAAVVDFMEDRGMPRTQSIHDIALEHEEWINNFWDQYEDLPQPDEDIYPFPLVSTTRPHAFVSLSECKDGFAIVIQGRNETQTPWRCLEMMGLDVVLVDNAATPPPLRRILSTRDFPSFTFSKVLSALSIQPAFHELLEHIDDDMHENFSEWARGMIEEDIPADLLSIGQNLPIWPAACATSPSAELRAALEIYMLPEGLQFDVAARFVSEYVADYGRLRHLRCSRLSASQLLEKLHLPSALNSAERDTYQNFLQILMPLLSDTTTAIPVPNGDGDVRSSRELYARQPLFQAAFGDASEHFIAPEFRNLEASLFSHGLRQENELNMDIFRACAEFIGGLLDEDRAARAAIVFNAYCIPLPLRLEPNERHRYHELDGIPFIPRDVDHTRRLDGQGPGLAPPSAISSLPSVVSPDELVREEFEAVCWTQKATFAVQPDPRILMAYPKLGKPRISDAIAHLRVLAGMGDLTSTERRIVLHDIHETYIYLNNHIASSEGEISGLRNENLFLNVTDPEADVWEWDSAGQLVFDSRDIPGVVRFVRSSLAPYAKLLRAAGVIGVDHPSCLPPTPSQSDKWMAMLDHFNELRLQEHLTDVAFLTKPADTNEIPTPLLAHRVFLTTYSQPLRDAFCGGYIESLPASPGAPVEIKVTEYSRACVQLTLEYMYTGAESIQGAQLDLLLETLRLAHYWDITALMDDVQREIISGRLIDPLTIETIRSCGEMVDASLLMEKCAEYEVVNAAYMQRVAQRVRP